MLIEEMTTPTLQEWIADWLAVEELFRDLPTQQKVICDLVTVVGDMPVVSWCELRDELLAEYATRGVKR